jgi:hypothetical protein
MAVCFLCTTLKLRILTKSKDSEEITVYLDDLDVKIYMGNED